MQWYHMITAALIFNALDIIAGIIAAVKVKNIMSSKLRDGLFKKAGFILCYALAWLVDYYAPYIGLTLNFAILPAVVAYVCMTEIVSIIESICKINSDLLPKKLTDLFHINIKEGE